MNLLSRAFSLAPVLDEIACELALALNVQGQRNRALELLANVATGGDGRIAQRARLEHAFVRSVAEPDHATELLEAASAAIPLLEEAGDDRALGRAWLCVGHVRGGFYCEYAAMQDAAERAITCYRRAGWSSSSAADYLGTALYFGPTPVGPAIERCEELLGELSGDKATEANLAGWLGGLEAMRGSFDVARAYVARSGAAFYDLGLTTAAIDSGGRILGAIELLAGRPAEAERALRESYSLLQELEHTPVVATRAAELAATVYEQGRFAEAAELIRIARDSAGDDDLDAALARQPVEAKVLAQQGDVDAAERLARETVKLAAATDALNRHADAVIALAEILERRDDNVEVRECIALALALYEAKGNAAAAQKLRDKTKSPVRSSSSSSPPSA